MTNLFTRKYLTKRKIAILSRMRNRVLSKNKTKSCWFTTRAYGTKCWIVV